MATEQLTPTRETMPGGATVGRLYMTGDLRALTGLPRTHMDFYLREGLVQPTLRTGSGYLLFDDAELETLRAVLRRGWVFLIPLGLLVYTLMIAVWDAGRAGIAAAVLTLIVGVVGRETRPTVAAVVRSVLDTGRILLDLVAISALAGLVIGALQLSGFTSKLPIVLTTLAGGDALGLLVLSALVCVVLGMSLPTVVVYVTLAVLVAPALAQLGIAPLAAHLFLFYFGMLSLITWALIIVVTVKYVFVVMRADNHGEGGVLALMALVSQEASIPARRRNVYVVLGMLGAALFYGDCLLTPAISVLSAVEGLNVATPAFEPVVLPIAMAGRA